MHGCVPVTGTAAHLERASSQVELKTERVRCTVRVAKPGVRMRRLCTGEPLPWYTLNKSGCGEAGLSGYE